MQIDILTLFPEMFKGVFERSIISRGIKNNIIKINLHNLRNWAIDKHNTVDDTPYGGGAGMVLKVDVIDRALHDLCSNRYKCSNRSNRFEQAKRFNVRSDRTTRTILLTPQGKTLNQQMVKKLSKNEKLILVCGHYEGFDERIRKLVDEEISIGQYVLTGGEIPAMVITDAVTRLLPGVLGKDESSQEESFSMNKLVDNNLKLKIKNLPAGRQGLKLQTESLIEYPHYTRPESYKPISKKATRLMKVPKILLSGNHQAIKKWRLDQAIIRTQKRQK